MKSTTICLLALVVGIIHAVAGEEIPTTYLAFDQNDNLLVAFSPIAVDDDLGVTSPDGLKVSACDDDTCSTSTDVTLSDCIRNFMPIDQHTEIQIRDDGVGFVVFSQNTENDDMTQQGQELVLVQCDPADCSGDVDIIEIGYGFSPSLTLLGDIPYVTYIEATGTRDDVKVGETRLVWCETAACTDVDDVLVDVCGEDLEDDVDKWCRHPEIVEYNNKPFMAYFGINTTHEYVYENNTQNPDDSGWVQLPLENGVVYLKFAGCITPACTNVTETYLDIVEYDNATLPIKNVRPALVVTTVPIAFYNKADDLMMAVCVGTFCEDSVPEVLIAGGPTAPIHHPSAAVDDAGNPVIVYIRDVDGDTDVVEVLTCSDPLCAATTTAADVITGDNFVSTNIAINSDGDVTIGAFTAEGATQHIVSCGSAACSSSSPRSTIEMYWDMDTECLPGSSASSLAVAFAGVIAALIATVIAM